MLREIGNILKITGKGRQFVVLLFLRCPFDIVSTLIQANFLQRAFDAVEQNDSAALAFSCLFFGVASLCLFLYNGTVWSAYAPFVIRLESRLRALLFDKISAFSYERIESDSQGEWITRLNTDVEMPFSRPFHLPHAACAIVNICVSAVILWRVHSEIFGWVILFAVPHIAISQLMIARAMPELGKKSLEATAKNKGEMAALISCVDISALYDGQDYFMKRFELSSLELFRANMKIRRRNALGEAIMPLFDMGGYLTLLVISGGWIAAGRFSFGDLTAAFQYRGGVLTGALTLIHCMINIQASMAGIKRLNETMRAERS
jgi:ABC-type multidrug transport system fused ATPase/permease subunit